MAFITFDPNLKDASITLSNGNLTATGSLTGPWRSVAAMIMERFSGKHYWEVTIDNDPGASSHMVGAGPDNLGVTSFPGQVSNSVGYYEHTGEVYVNGTPSAYGDTYTTNDVIGVALDLDNGKIFFSKNGVWQNSGNPETGANPAANITASNGWMPWHGFNFINAEATINFGESTFSYSVPNGYEPFYNPLFLDTFTGSNGSPADPYYWLTQYDVLAPTIQNNQWHTDVEGSYQRIYSYFTIGGDFDVQVDYDDLSSPGIIAYSVELRLQSLSTNHWVKIRRAYDTPEYYRSQSYDGATHTLNSTSTTDTSGRFRITRRGTEVKTWRWHSGGYWENLATDTFGALEDEDDIRVILETNSSASDPHITADYDNLIVLEGTSDWYGFSTTTSTTTTTTTTTAPDGDTTSTTTTTTTTTTAPFEEWDDIYYYRFTQAIANRLPDWTRGQADKYSVIQQLLNVAGKELEIIVERMRRSTNSLFLRTMDMRAIDLTYQIELPYSFEFEYDFTDPTNPRPKPPDVWGIVDGNIYEINAVADNDIVSFWYEPIGDRVSLGPDEETHLVGDVAKLTSGDVLPATAIGVGKVDATYYDPLIPGQLFVTIADATKFGFQNRRTNLPGYLEINGVTVKDSEETERIPYSYNATVLTRKFWKEITDIYIYNIEPSTATLTITSAAGTMQQIPDVGYVDYDTITGRPSSWELEENNSQAVLQQLLPTPKIVTDRVGMGFELNVFREWILANANGLVIAYADVVDYALERYRPYFFALTSNGILNVYNKLPEYPDLISMRLLKNRTSGTKTVIQTNYDEGIIGDQIRISAKVLTKTKPVSFYYIQGAKPHHEGELQYIGTDGTWGVTIGEAREIMVTPTVDPPYKPYLIDLEEGGCYVFMLTTRYVDGSEDKDVKIVWSRYKMPIASFDLMAADATLTTPLAICFDYNHRLWLGGMYGSDFKFKELNLHADLMLIDYDKKLLYLREEYDRVWIGENEATTSTSTTTSTTTTTTTTAVLGFQDDDFENGSLETFWATDFGVGGGYAEEGGALNLLSGEENVTFGGTADFNWIYQPIADGIEGDFDIIMQMGDFAGMTVNEQIAGIVAYIDNDNWAAIGKYYKFGLQRWVNHRVSASYHQNYTSDTSTPQWFRVERVGTTFNTYYSNNGMDWFLLNPSAGELTGSGAVKIGLFANDQFAGDFDVNFYLVENRTGDQLVVVPDGDVLSQWSTGGAGTGRWDRVNVRVATPDDTNYIYGADGDAQRFSMTSPSYAGACTRMRVYARGYDSFGYGLTVEIYDGAAKLGNSDITAFSGSYTNQYGDWLVVSKTAAELADIELKITGLDSSADTYVSEIQIEIEL